MSVVAAKIFTDRIIMSSDSGVWGDTRNNGSHFKPTKMFKINGILAGFSGTFEEGTLFQAFCETHKPDGTSFKNIVDFMSEFRRWLKNISYEEKLSNFYLLAFDSTLWYIHGWEVIEVKDCYSVGAGEDYALTAMHLGKSPSVAVKVACDMCCYAAEPIIEDSIPFIK
jgi:ATP-dependent protease HslVU (ClpYQ) peptidase subunit